MIELQQASTISIFGPVASGKTDLMNRLMRPFRRVLWYDTTFEIDFSEIGWEHIAKPSDLVNRLHKGASFHRIAYHPALSDFNAEFDAVSRLYWQEGFPRWYVIDEVHEFSTSDTLVSMMKYARKRLMGIVCASQRMADVPKAITANSRAVVLFYTQESNDHVAIKDRFGSEALEKVQGLRPLIYDDVSRTVKQYPECVYYRRGMPLEIVELKG